MQGVPLLVFAPQIKVTSSAAAARGFSPTPMDEPSVRSAVSLLVGRDGIDSGGTVNAGLFSTIRGGGAWRMALPTARPTPTSTPATKNGVAKCLTAVRGAQYLQNRRLVHGYQRVRNTLSPHSAQNLGL